MNLYSHLVFPLAHPRELKTYTLPLPSLSAHPSTHPSPLRPPAHPPTHEKNHGQKHIYLYYSCLRLTVMRRLTATLLPTWTTATQLRWTKCTRWASSTLVVGTPWLVLLRLPATTPKRSATAAAPAAATNVAARRHLRALRATLATALVDQPRGLIARSAPS
jgi:hypothetical protein